jgi:hypothetical protein
MHGCATDLDGDFWIENAYSGLKWFKGTIFIGEHTKYAGFNTKANARRNVFLSGLEPGVTLSLHGRGSEQCGERAEHGSLSVGNGIASECSTEANAPCGVHPYTRQAETFGCCFHLRLAARSDK